MQYLTDEHYAIAETNGIPKKLAYNRWYNGMTVQDAITKPKPKHWDDWQEMKEIALAHGVSSVVFRNRMKLNSRKWTKEEAATTPPLKRGKEFREPPPKRYKNITPELIAIAEQNGISQKLLSIRKARKWSDERASTEPPNQKYVTRGEAYVSHS